MKVKRADLRVRHRRSYRDKSTLERAADRTLAALFFGSEDNPLEVSLEIGDITPAAKGGYTVPVRLRIISNTQAASAGGAEPGSQGLRNLRLPATVAGTSPQPSVAPTPAGAQQ